MLCHRVFKDYETYKAVQGIKARENVEELLVKAPGRIRGFEKFFSACTKYMSEGSVLCLGARTGCEIVGACRAGFHGSIGIDLHPIGDKVIEADWADMPFDAESFDNIFTNSIDHVLDIDVLIKEIHRVLKPSGVFILMISHKTNDKAGPHTLENWTNVSVKEGLYWDKPFDVAQRFIDFGFGLSHKFVKGKWHVFFLRKDK